eukprot:11431178-Ditylum_brightwellii.AAC.1
MPKWIASFEPSSMPPKVPRMMPSSHPSPMPSSIPNMKLLAAIILAKLDAIFDTKHGAKRDAIISAQIHAIIYPNSKKKVKNLSNFLNGAEGLLLP